MKKLAIGFCALALTAGFLSISKNTLLGAKKKTVN